MKTRHVYKKHLYFHRLVDLLQGDLHPIGVLYKRVFSSFMFYLLFHEDNIYTYWMLLKDDFLAKMPMPNIGRKLTPAH